MTLTHTIPDLPIFHKATQNPTKVAIHSDGRRYRYGDLLRHSLAVQSVLTENDDPKSTLDGQRVAFLCPGSYSYVVAQWAIWRSNGVCVPLCTAHPLPEMQYVVEDSGATILVAHKKYSDRVKPIAEKLGRRFIELPDFHEHPQEELEMKMETFPVDHHSNAMLIYTSGTTGKPKGALSTHHIIDNQITSLTTAWAWSDEDHILHTLPLHHIHGIVNKLCCALHSGAQVTFLPRFDAQQVFDALVNDTSITLYMAVPTIYVRLIRHYEQLSEDAQKTIRDALARLRFMVSGSASLPAPVSTRWTEISSQILLERYGMTECGMIISNPLEVDKRKPGFVGKPLPGVQVKIGENDSVLVKSKGMFKEYWNKPEATASAFDEEGWFKTGDQAVLDASDGTYRMLGRASVDILKSAGFKISALDVERVLLEHPGIREVMVVGVPDIEYEQLITAVVVQQEGATSLTTDTLKQWAKTRMAAYKVPRRLFVVSEIPCKNVMGKCNKKALTQLIVDEKI